MTSTTESVAKLNKPVLKEGSQGAAVKELQKLLFDKGFYDNCRKEVDESIIDGIFGIMTTSAVRSFQAHVFLPVDGVVGDRTWRALFKNAPVDMPTLKLGSKDVGLVKIIQQKLIFSGDYQGIIDGVFGAKTEAAVKALQKRTRLTVDGIVGDRTWFELSKIRNPEGGC
ncbi:peptidoglycan-binding domain 1 [Calothrix sp. NIES-4101]|nr:peptidoglycan-binding domain 1 [Calothrix sp. NIES-4101]